MWGAAPSTACSDSRGGGSHLISVLGPCLDRHFRIAMAIAQGLEGHKRERERERDSLIVAGELDTEGSL